MERRGARDIEGKVTRVGASKSGGERVSIKKRRSETHQEYVAFPFCTATCVPSATQIAAASFSGKT